MAQKKAAHGKAGARVGSKPKAKAKAKPGLTRKAKSSAKGKSSAKARPPGKAKATTQAGSFGKAKAAAKTRPSDRPGSAERPRAAHRRTSRHVETLLSLPRSACVEFFDTSPPEKLIEVFEESFRSELVNLLLDLKKATVKRFFELLAGCRRRGLQEVATLYYYKEYLTNPLPLQVETEIGRSVPNYYAILGVSRDATEEELKAAYRLLARAHDPDAFSPSLRKAAQERLAEIEDAYSNLKSPQRRQRADRLLPNISYLYPRREQTWLEVVQRILG